MKRLKFVVMRRTYMLGLTLILHFIEFSVVSKMQMFEVKEKSYRCILFIDHSGAS